MDKVTSVLDNETEKEILIEFQRPKDKNDDCDYPPTNHGSAL